jgi:hypothetical protein
MSDSQVNVNPHARTPKHASQIPGQYKGHQFTAIDLDQLRQEYHSLRTREWEPSPHIMYGGTSGYGSGGGSNYIDDSETWNVPDSWRAKDEQIATLSK